MIRIAVLALALAAVAARAAVTNVVDVAALVAAVDAGMSETNGWTLSGLGKYADDSSLFFNARTDNLLSPDYGAQIIGVVASNRCSTLTPARVMCVFDGMTEREVGRFPVVAAINKQERQSLVFSDLGLTRIRFQTTSGSSGNWGIGSLKVITADPIAAPTALTVVKTNTTSCVLEWENGANTVSNRIDTYRVMRGAGETAIFETDFDGFNGNASQTKDFSDDVPEMLGDAFSGVRVYGAAGMTGVCQLGTGSSLGSLRYAGLSSYDGVSLRIRVKRYSGDNAATTIAYEHGGTTNEVETITLPDDFGDIVVSLSAVPDGAAVLLGYYKTKSNRRVLIDSLSIVRSGAIEETLVDSRFIPAAPGAMRFSTIGAFDLVPNAEYRFEVFAQSGDGILSPAVSAEARLLADVPGFGIILR